MFTFLDSFKYDVDLFVAPRKPKQNRLLWRSNKQKKQGLSHEFVTSSSDRDAKRQRRRVRGEWQPFRSDGGLGWVRSGGGKSGWVRSGGGGPQK